MTPFRDGLQFAFDSTSLKWGQECLRKYQYYMIEGWTRLHGNVHLEFGGAYASALEHFHKHIAAGMDREAALIDVVVEALTSTWDTERNEPKEWDHPAKTRANLIRTIIWYVDFFNPDPVSTVILANGSAAVEYSFKLELAPDILYCGHIDRLVAYNGDVYVQDQKTTGSTISARFFDGFAPDTQISGYAYAGSIIHHTPVRGVIIDGAQIAVGFSRFERGYSFRTPAQLEEWRTDSLRDIKRIQEATRENHFPQNPTACGNYGGCPFRTVCSRSPEVRPAFLRAEFEQTRNWNPLVPR